MRPAIRSASTVNSYRRLWDTGFWAPVFADWGFQNRTCGLRVSAPGRFEYRAVEQPVLPTARVHFVGQPIAAVVAQVDLDAADAFFDQLAGQQAAHAEAVLHAAEQDARHHSDQWTWDHGQDAVPFDHVAFPEKKEAEAHG